VNRAVTRVAVLDDYQHVAETLGDWRSLPRGTEVVYFHDHLHDEDAIVERLRDFDIVAIMRERTPFPRSLIARLPRLRLLVTTGIQNRAVDVAAAQAKGVVVSGTGSFANGAPELTWALILGALRHLPQEDAATRTGAWQQTVGSDLKGRVIGILGLGRIGSHAARVAHAFEMDVIAWSQNLTAERAAESGARYVEKDDLFRLSDIVTIHLVLSPRTRALVGARELALMKPTALLVNTSRGPIVDEDALVSALRERRIGGAALDVFDREPLPPGHPLLGLPNTVLTPHLGFVTETTYRRYFHETVEDIAAFLAGNPIRLVEQAGG
jgi:phosphoglycerate dehydrogenase-like enzyme